MLQFYIKLRLYIKLLTIPLKINNISSVIGFTLLISSLMYLLMGKYMLEYLLH